MKCLRKIAGISVLFTLVFMVIALFRFQSEEEFSFLPQMVEHLYDEGWTAAVLDGANMPNVEEQSPDEVKKLLKDTLKPEMFQSVELPWKGTSNPGDIVVLKNILPADYEGLTLSFFSKKSSVMVFLDGKMIYQYGIGEQDSSENHISQERLEDMENYVDIPNDFQGGELWIEQTSPRPNAAAVLNNIKIETRDMVVIGVVVNNIADIGCCLLILLMAIIMFVLAMIRRYTRQPVRGELFLGLAGVAAGVYCFIGTDTLNIFYDMQQAYEMQEYLVLMLPLFLTLYFERNLHTVYPRRFFVLLWGVILNAAVQILLHKLEIRSLVQMVNLSAAWVGIVCIVAIVSLIQMDYRNKGYQTVPSILSMVILLSGGIANVIMNTILKSAYGNTAGQYSMVIFSVIMAVMHVFQISKEYRASAEENASLLEEKVKAAQQQNMQLAQAKKDADGARREALAANEAKGKFLAHMSHEIRTPINAVLGMDEMILRESKEQAIKEYAMDIYTAGQTLLSLINDILDFSKIESGKMEIVPVEYDISSMIHDLANMTAQRAEHKNLKLEVEIDRNIPARLYGDDVRIRQVLTNILTNAVKYTHEGTVWLRVQSRRKNDMAILSFEVEDTGIGIKEEDLPKLSAEFERIEEDRNRNIEGSGLGMNITIQLLGLLGSKLQVESVYGKGSKFYFDLEQKVVDDTPIGDFETRVRQIAEDYNYTSKFCAPDAKLLVVDDNAVNRKVLRNLLKETQIQVTDAAGGAECLELVQRNHYDLIFLDHMMPEMDGVETLHYIKEFTDFPCQDTPIVVLTANAVSGAKEKYLAEGFDDFLSKPVVPEKLEAMIRKMLPEELQQEAEIPVTAESEGQKDTGSCDEKLEELPQIDGLDWQYAWLHLPDMELLEYTVKEFYEQIDSAANHLEEAFGRILEPEQLDRYRIQVHAMKSLAATVGIMPLSGVAKLLEFAARDGKIEVVLSITPSFLEEWRSYRQKLQGVFGLGTSAKKQLTDVSMVQALVEMVRFSMQEMDIDQADQLVAQLKEYEYPDEMKENLQKLADAVTNLDPEEADRFGELLMEQLKQLLQK
ncbi:MAG: response regulator [Lachnospiraceae bacterium]|nr:response regulator [Lachnospiraceae bacterium]